MPANTPSTSPSAKGKYVIVAANAGKSTAGTGNPFLDLFLGELHAKISGQIGESKLNEMIRGHGLTDLFGLDAIHYLDERSLVLFQLACLVVTTSSEGSEGSQHSENDQGRQRTEGVSLDQHGAHPTPPVLRERPGAASFFCR